MKKKKFILFPTSKIDLKMAQHICESYKGFRVNDHLTMLEITIFLVFSAWGIPYANATSPFVAACLTITFWMSLVIGLTYLIAHIGLYLWYRCALKALERCNRTDKDKKP